jgi:26S proteasome regulatory subunit N2
MRQQLKVISIAEGSPYVAMKEVNIGGIIMMQHTAQTDQELVEPVAAYGPKNEEVKEPDAPEPFEFTDE